MAEPKASTTLRRSWIFAILALFLAFLLFDQRGQRKATTLPYSDFRRLLDEGRIREVSVAADRITGVLKEPLPGGEKHFTTLRVDPALANDLTAHGVRVSGTAQTSWLWAVLAWFGPLLLFWLVAAYLYRRMAGGGRLGGQFMAVGKSKARIYVESNTKVNFGDVAGVEEAKAELVEIVEFLRAPKEYGRLGARMPKGILLVGPPGTGKTLLARAVAGEAGVPFFSISGSEFVELFVGVGAARVRDLFEQASLKAPCIIFIDELDALGRARTAGFVGGGYDEKEQTLNQLLVELDGFDPRTGVVLLAATNRPELLDPALLRAGRFDRQVLVDRPDRGGRLAILEVHLKKVSHLDADVDAAAIAAATPGFTGADLANLVNEAALLATRRKADTISQRDFDEATERIVAGLEKKNRVLNPRERKIVAFHEMGHALVSASLPGTDPIQKVSVIPRGLSALGYTIQRPVEDRYLVTREELQTRIAVMLGGRAAEMVVFGSLSTGAVDDLAQATDLARNMVTRYGMDDKLGYVTYDREPTPAAPGHPGDFNLVRRYSEESAQAIDDAVRRIVETGYTTSFAILNRERTVLDEGAAALLEHETLDAQALKPYFARLGRDQ